MQWLIDIIQEWIIAQGYKKTGFVNRGFAAAFDFITIDFTTDSLWHELDLSDIVPANARGVAFTFIVRRNAAGRYFLFHGKPADGAFNVSQGYTQVASQYYAADFVTGLSEDRKIEYKIQAGVWDFLELTIKGWWF